MFSIYLLAVGRWKSCPEKSLFELYQKRMNWPFKLIEVEEKRRLVGGAMKQRQAVLIEQALPKRSYTVGLDEKGKKIGSVDFAQKLNLWQGQQEAVTFIIGGADGLASSLLDKVDFRLSLSDLTFPHMMVRPLLAEQVYRAQQILIGHPYHRV